MNVLVVKHYPENQHELLPQVVEELKKLNGGHRYRLVYDVKPQLKHQLWSFGQPTRVVSFYQLREFKPAWAKIWTQGLLTKTQEYQILDRAGVAVPRWTKMTEDHKPDLSTFSDYVVTKPDWGCCGALVRVVAKGRVKWEKPVVDKTGYDISDDWVIQEFIHTGPFPISYRIGTVFGEPVYAWRTVASQTRKPFNDSSKRDSQFFDGRTIVSSSRGCTFDLDVPEDVLEFARKVHSAFPNIPLLGTDVLRDFNTGKLYAIDFNSVGNVFHLTSETGKKIMSDFNLDLFAQFGGAKAIARGIFNRVNQTAPEMKNKELCEVVNS